MSKAAKQQSKLRRASLKRGRKASNQLLYQSRAAAGTNTISKRAKLAAKRSGGLTTKRHQELNCGNRACRRCFPDLYSLPGGCNYGSRFTTAPKPYQTSRGKITATINQIKQDREQAKAVRQDRNARHQASVNEMKQKAAAAEIIWMEWAANNRAIREATKQAAQQQPALLGRTEPVSYFDDDQSVL